MLAEISIPSWVYHVHLEFRSFIRGRIPPDGTNVNHSIAEFDKRSPLLGQLEICDVSETEICQRLISLFPYPIDEAIAGKRLPDSVRG